MSGMVEKRGIGVWLTHLGLIIGIGVVCFPIYFAFVASTVTQADIIRPPLPMLPGPTGFGRTKPGAKVPAVFWNVKNRSSMLGTPV